ncbi:integrase core domain-containing protein [Dactylosporangium darangshiense]|uniref:Integrase catalytic domain-containing protein n=1 Tax=Dactylosporangium darangshiense TaxID=579108 RepID=A0ABP8DWA7_9ACTN
MHCLIEWRGEPVFPPDSELPDARTFCHTFFNHYNHAHWHKALGLHTPASVHFGTATDIRTHRAAVLHAAHARSPERFSRPPTPPPLPTTAWINPPTPAPQIQTA